MAYTGGGGARKFAKPKRSYFLSFISTPGYLKLLHSIVNLPLPLSFLLKSFSELRRKLVHEPSKKLTHLIFANKIGKPTRWDTRKIGRKGKGKKEKKKATGLV